MELNTLRPSDGRVTKKKRVGRGIGPLTSAPVLFAVSTISIEDLSNTP